MRHESVNRMSDKSMTLKGYQRLNIAQHFIILRDRASKLWKVIIIATIAKQTHHSRNKVSYQECELVRICSSIVFFSLSLSRKSTNFAKLTCWNGNLMSLCIYFS